MIKRIRDGTNDHFSVLPDDLQREIILKNFNTCKLVMQNMATSSMNKAFEKRMMGDWGKIQKVLTGSLDNSATKQTVKSMCSKKSIKVGSAIAMCTLDGGKYVVILTISKILMYNSLTWNLVSTIGIPNVNNALGLCALDDHKIAVLFGYGMMIRIWKQNGNSLTETLGIQRPSHTNMRTMSPLPDDMVALGDVDYNNPTIYIYDVKNLKIKSKLVGHSGQITSSMCPFIKPIEPTKSKYLISTSRDGTICRWDIESGKEDMRFRKENNPTPWHSVCQISENRIAAGSSSEGGRIYVYEISNKIQQIAYSPSDIMKPFICSLPRNRLACGDQAGRITFFDLNNLKKDKYDQYGNLKKDQYNQYGVPIQGDSKQIHTSKITGLCLLPGNRLASSSWDNTNTIHTLNL